MAPAEFTARLAAELRPTPRSYVLRRLAVGAGAGLAISLVALTALLGLRADLVAALATRMFWVKLGYVSVLAALAIWTVERLARPGEPAAARGVWIGLPVLAIAVVGALRLARTTPDLRGHVLMGESAALCPWLILLASLPPLAGLGWALRGLAPTRPKLAGAVTGLAAGGVGAAAYCMHCSESTLPFLAAWYTLGVAAAGLAGAALGSRLLRW